MVPHRCPVCLGHGNVPGGFYNAVPGGTPVSTNTSEKCRSCINGIIYSGDPVFTGTGDHPFNTITSPPKYDTYPELLTPLYDEILQVLKQIRDELQTLNRRRV